MSDQLTKAINQQIKFNYPLAQNLNILDAIVRQMGIEPTSHIALQAYQFICMQYIQNKTPSNSSKGPSSPKQSNFGRDVDDPEIFAHFSFAKNANQHHNQHFMGPKATVLFKEKQMQVKMLKSEKVMTKKLHKQQKNYVSSFNLMQGQQQQQSCRKNVDIKEQSRVRLKQTEQRQQQLRELRKRHFFNQLVKLIQKQKQIIRNILKRKSAEYFRNNSINNRVINTLKNQVTLSKRKAVMAHQFSQRNDEALLQQFFIGWRERAMRSQAERQLQVMIQQKYVHLCQVRMLNNIKKYHQVIHQREAEIVRKNKQLKLTLKTFSKTLFYEQLRLKHQINIQLQKTNESLLLLLQKSEFLVYSQLINKFKIFRQNRQNYRVQRLIRLTKGLRLITNLKSQYQLKKVYWRKPQKIMLLKMMFEGISDSLKRKGYQHQWMQELPMCLEKTDCKLRNIANKYELSRIFNGIKRVLAEQRQKYEKIKMIHGERILKQVINNFRISIITQKQNYQMELLIQFVKNKHLVEHFEAFRSNTQQYIDRKQSEIRQLLRFNSIKKTIAYLKANRWAKAYFSRHLQAFKDKLNYNCLRRTFEGFQEVTQTTVINNKIIEQFRNYRDRRLLQNIMQCLKEHTFQEKLMKKRQSNLKKLRAYYYFDRICYNMRVSLYAHHKEKEDNLQKNIKRFISNRMKKNISSLYTNYQKRNIKRNILQKIQNQYKIRFCWKFFNAMKIVTEKISQQKQICERIVRNKEMRIKKVVMDEMVSKLVLSLSFKRSENIGMNALMRETFIKIKHYDYQKTSIKEETMLQNESYSQQNQ